jgi:Ni2+-binding GTPase involved in maturation of urease and hydrogenase
LLERFFWCVALSANIWAEYNALGFFLRQVTNDIFTEEDGEFLVKHGALAPERICAVQTGGCPHAAIREDISINLGPLEELSKLIYCCVNLEAVRRISNLLKPPL